LLRKGLDGPVAPRAQRAFSVVGQAEHEAIVEPIEQAFG